MAWTWGQPWPKSCGTFPTIVVQLYWDGHGAVRWNGGPISQEDLESALKDTRRTVTSGKENIAFTYLGKAEGKARLVAVLKRHGFDFHPECAIPGIP